MSAEYWMLAILVVAVALAAGFFAGRGTAPAQQRLKALERERDEARAEVERVQGEVARHFEQSARMFGRLADDYRSFFEHFAQTAQNLGLSETRARELLQRADPRLVADQSGAGRSAGEGVDGAGADPGPDPDGAGREAGTGTDETVTGTDAQDDRRT